MQRTAHGCHILQKKKGKIKIKYFPPSSVFLGLRDIRLLNSVNELFELLECFAALIGRHRRFGIVIGSQGQGQAVQDQSTNAVEGSNSCLV